MPPKSPIWRLFSQDGSLYLTDRSHKASWCKACLQKTVEALKREAYLAVVYGTGNREEHDKTQDEWEIIGREKLPPVCGKINSLQVHVRACGNIDKATRDSVLQDQKEYSATQAAAKENKCPQISVPLLSVSLAPSLFPTLSTFGNSPLLSPLLTPKPLPSPLTDSLLFPPDPHPSKRPCLSRSISTHDENTEAVTLPPEIQQEFGEDLCKLLVTLGLPFNVVAHPEFKLFTQKWMPGLMIPDRRTISGTILENEANKVILATRQLTEGKLAHYQCDGWKNTAKTPVISSMVTVDTKPYLLRTHDMTGRPKTGDELYDLVKKDIEYAQNIYGIEVIAITTDDGPDGKKMRRLHSTFYPHIATFVCWAHQCGLLTGNYLGIKAPFMESANKAMEVVKWFNNHQRALDFLRAQQFCSMGRTLALILPAATRWTGYYCALRRLRSQMKPILGCVAANKAALLTAAGTQADLQAKALEIITICSDEDFWNNLEKIVSHLEPLAISANILQDPACRLDHVLLTLAKIFCFFETLRDTDDGNVQIKMHAHLERRWGNADQELFILGVFFNPYIRARCFNSDNLSQYDIFHTVRRVYQRIFRQTVHGDFNFTKAFEDYYAETGVFSSDAMYLSGFEDEYRTSGRDSIDFVGIWKKLMGSASATENIASPGGKTGFVKLAIRILSMVPNSAGTECVFSTFGLTHTKTRNRISPQKVHNATLIRMSRRRAHIAAGLVPQWGKRKFGEEKPEPLQECAESFSSEPDSEPLDYQTIADQLINSAAEDEENVDLEELLPSTLGTIPSTQSVTVTEASANTRIPPYKKVKLQDLFMFPSKGGTSKELDFYWAHGIEKVNEEENELDTLA